ncbi:MAG: ABC transporter permease [Bacteriovorax sp.]
MLLSKRQIAIKKTATGLVTFLILAAIWEISARLGWINAFILPAPSRMIATFIEMLKTGELYQNVLVSFLRVGTGFLLACVIAIPLGFALSLNSTTKNFLFPLFNFIRPIPPIAWMPLAILWFGIGHGPAIFLTMIAALFTILFGTMFGVEEISKEHLNVARCFQASSWLTFKDVILPASFPSLFSGLRLGFGLSWMAVVGAEMIASTSGLGHMISVAQDSLRTDIVIIGMATIGFTAYFCDLLFRFIGNLLMPWRKERA